MTVTKDGQYIDPTDTMTILGAAIFTTLLSEGMSSTLD
jgi:hypothetical protein